MSETYYFLLEKKGIGWTVKGYYQKSGLKRYYGMKKFKILQMSYSELKQWIHQQQHIFTLPYRCDIVDGDEWYQVVYINENLTKVKENIERNPEDICGNFIIDKTWL